jgi:hypothetical protein
VRVVQEPVDSRGRQGFGHQLVKAGRVNVFDVKAIESFS